jgi:DNA-binding XRE family transcriptional regulator
MKQRTEIDINISKRFAEVRKETGLNKTAFSKSIGVHNVICGDIELGKREPSRQVLVKLAKTYGTDLNWLLTGETSKIKNILTE